MSTNGWVGDPPLPARIWRFAQILLFLLFLLCVIPAALAHSLEVQVTLDSPFVLLEAGFAGGTALSGGTVEIYRPGGVTEGFTSGTLDRHGRFAFTPDVEGRWSAVIDDGLGHREMTTITLPEGFLANTAAPSSQASTPTAPTLLSRLLLGLGGICALTGLLAWWRARALMHAVESRR